MIYYSRSLQSHWLWTIAESEMHHWWTQKKRTVEFWCIYTVYTVHMCNQDRCRDRQCTTRQHSFPCSFSAGTYVYIWNHISTHIHTCIVMCILYIYYNYLCMYVCMYVSSDIAIICTALHSYTSKRLLGLQPADFPLDWGQRLLELASA